MTALVCITSYKHSEEKVCSWGMKSCCLFCLLFGMWASPVCWPILTCGCMRCTHWADASSSPAVLLASSTRACSERAPTPWHARSVRHVCIASVCITMERATDLTYKSQQANLWGLPHYFTDVHKAEDLSCCVCRLLMWCVCSPARVCVCVCGISWTKRDNWKLKYRAVITSSLWGLQPFPHSPLHSVLHSFLSLSLSLDSSVVLLDLVLF